MHVGSYNFLASKQEAKESPPKKMNPKKKHCQCVHVFIAYTPTKLTIMYMYDVCREAEREGTGKKKASDES